MQAKFHNGACSRDPAEWFENHREDYGRVLERLASVRAVTLTGDLESAAENIKHAYMNAVLSVRTDLDRHERAYAKWAHGGADAKEALLDTVYGGSKIHQWGSIEVLENTDWRNVALAVRAHVRNGRIDALLGMCEHIRGVAFRKWSFTLAMAGVWEVACIDSNVGNIMDIEMRDDFDSDADTYLRTLERVRDRIDAPVPPFLAQWCVYDFARGEHARHMVFFNSVNRQ